MKNLHDVLKREILSKINTSPCCENSFNAGLNQDENVELKCKNCLKNFLCGLYINTGFANILLSDDNLSASTGRGYSLEFLLYSEDFAEYISGIMAENEIDVKVTLRQNKVLLYVTDLNSIEHFLSLIGANKSLLALENEVLNRELREKANRAVNATENNIKKHVEATNKQIEQIKEIDRLVGINSLPFTLKTAAVARLNNPNLTLTELADEIKISKSALNHRLRKVCEIYKNLIK